MFGFMVALTLLGSAEQPSRPAEPGRGRLRGAGPGAGGRDSGPAATTCLSRFPPIGRPPVRGRAIVAWFLSAPHRVVFDFAQPRDRLLAVRAGGRPRPPCASPTVTSSSRPSATAAGGERDRDRVHRRRRGAEPQRRVPLHAVRPGARAARVSLLRSAGSEGALHAVARRARRLAGGGQRRETRHAERRRRTATIDVRRDASRCRPICSRSRPASSPSRPRSATAGRCACSTARPTRRRSRATATRSSICTRGRSPGSRTTPPSRIRSASSTSC